MKLRGPAARQGRGDRVFKREIKQTPNARKMHFHVGKPVISSIPRGALVVKFGPAAPCHLRPRLRHAPCLPARTGCLTMLAAGAMPVCIEAAFEAVEPARGKVVAVTDTRAWHLAEQAEDMVRM